ncbi:putative AMP-binding enzyme [Aspergillus homomorphus CBS 101889]|uniref:Putative AMP-binding enzyme n=1 Tax=Aspergillus homomorphus (strain CBS 101889) TaxID=1450537 RepID=A0A395HRC2_ASPHC|nr:putative AMP-binding enzyme [Aspergillus homomorphus CBS 101889]RAL10367.1 putative AMP-binding enzyme [Aspergillus homomorphus CBS 101889]
MEQTPFPLPGIQHGRRILATVVETRAKNEPNSPWISVPIDDADLSRGYRDISFQQLNNAANHAARWLHENLLASTEPFQCFAYAGPKDFRYPILAVAAAKLQKVIVLPSPLITPEAQLRIFRQKSCTLYLRPATMAEHVATILREAPEIQTLTVPELGEFLREAEAAPYTYSKTWEEGKDEPWIVFHTSGTTGFPKPITYTQSMMTSPDIAASLPDIEYTHVHQYALRRWYTPLPSLHFVGTVMTLSMTSFLHMVAVVGPAAPPSPPVVADILRYGRVDGALLTPAIIDELCLIPSGLDALRQMKYVHFAGAPLSAKAGAQLSTHVHLVPCIGSTEAGGYFTTVQGKDRPWDYITFQKHAGAEFEHRFNELHELVFVRRPECTMQQIFSVYPDRDRFETNDLWVEHPEYRGSWKIIGRTDDYVALAHADGLHASLLEPEIEAHPGVKSALIGGHGRPAPVLIVEFFPEAEMGQDQQAVIESLRPYLEKVNAHVHECVSLSADRTIIAGKHKPFVRTIKGSVARLQTLSLYEDEIAALFAKK